MQVRLLVAHGSAKAGDTIEVSRSEAAELLREQRAVPAGANSIHSPKVETR